MFHLVNLSEVESQEFVRKLIDQFVDKAAVEKLVEDGELGSDYNPDTYPFTPAAYDRFIDYWKRNSEDAKPRDITDQMTDAAFIAMRQNSRLIDEGALEGAGM